MPIIGTIASSFRAAPVAVQAYDSIASTSLTSPVGSVTFSSIPSTYKHLQLRIMGLSEGNVPIGFIGGVGNGTVATSGFGWQGISRTSGAIAIYGVTSSSSYRFGSFAEGNTSNTEPYVFVVDFFDYANTNKVKHSTTIGGGDTNGQAGCGEVGLISSFWNSTSAINIMTIRAQWGVTAVNFNTGSTFALYGLKGV